MEGILAQKKKDMDARALVLIEKKTRQIDKLRRRISKGKVETIHGGLKSYVSLSKGKPTSTPSAHSINLLTPVQNHPLVKSAQDITLPPLSHEHDLSPQVMPAVIYQNYYTPPSAPSAFHASQTSHRVGETQEQDTMHTSKSPVGTSTWGFLTSGGCTSMLFVATLVMIAGLLLLNVSLILFGGRPAMLGRGVYQALGAP